MPSGKVAKPDITDNKDGTVTVKYAPTEAGLHEMDIKYDGIHIPGNTLTTVHEVLLVTTSICRLQMITLAIFGGNSQFYIFAAVIMHISYCGINKVLFLLVLLL